MKNTFQYYFFLFIGFLYGNLFAGNPSWTSSPFEQKVFVENLGQFNGFAENNSDKVLFGVSSEGLSLYFTPKGLTYVYYETVPMTEEEMEEMEKHEKGKEKKEKESEMKLKIVPHFLSAEWVNSNPNVQILSEVPVSFYYTYPGGAKANAFKKIIYKNLYPDIDLEYVFPADKSGIKYSFILHPGANPSDIKMKWGENTSQDVSGNIIVKSSFGDFIDHAPETFYENGGNIASSFIKSGSTISFSLGSYDNSKTVIIDPWTSSPTFSMNKAYDVDYDYNGNVYAYGSWTPTFQLAKFNNAGALQWIYNAYPMVRYVSFYGDFVVDPFTGFSYLGEGCDESFPTAPPFVIKVDPAGNLVDSVKISPTGPPQFEIWRMDYDICTHTILAAGGGINGSSPQATVLDVNLNIVTNGQPVFAPVNDCDVALATIDKYSNGTRAYMLPNAMMSLNPRPYDNNVKQVVYPGLTSGAWMTPTGHLFTELGSLTYVGPAVAPTCSRPVCGYNGIAVSQNYVYTYDSDSLKRWDKNTGAAAGAIDASPTPAVIATPGNFCFSGFVPSIQPGWGGLDVDECDNNVYVGVDNTIRVFDASMNLINTFNLPNKVYDVKLGINDKLYASGNGFVTQIDLAPTTTTTITYTVTQTPATGCSTCNGMANANASGTVPCGPPPVFTYEWQPGGQTTQTITGLCPGNYTVYISRNCAVVHTDTVQITGGGNITASTNSNPTTCGFNNGSVNVTISSGTAPYTYNWSPAIGSTSAISNLNAGNYTVTVTDAGGCSTTQTVSIAPSTGITATAGPNPTICAGTSATISATGGGTYSWTNGNSNSSITISPTSSTTYSVIVINNGCSDTASATVTVNPLPIVNVPSTTVCTGDVATLTASGGTNYLWSNGSTTNPIVVSPASTTSYSVIATDANGCSNSTTVTVNISPPPIAASTSATICSGQTASLTANGGGIYLWSNGNTNASISVSPAVTSNYSVIVSFGSCADTSYSSVTVNPSPSLNLGSSQTICAGQSVTLNAGNPGASYVWSTGETTQFINISSVGSYWVIVAFGNCLVMDTVNTFSAPGISLSDSSLCTTSPIVLDPGSGAVSYYWSTGSTTQTISVDIAGTYYVTAMFGNCAATAVAVIDGIPGGEGNLYVPNAFTPNGDRQNEIFLAKGEGIVSFNMNIFDRWGNLIFDSDDLAKGWNGKIEGGHYTFKQDGRQTSQQDVYIWKISYTTECFPKRPKKIIGHVSIIK